MPDLLEMGRIDDLQQKDRQTIVDGLFEYGWRGDRASARAYTDTPVQLDIHFVPFNLILRATR
ncbi:hypothetical protein O4H66_15620 [Comamonadaceae bacterium G21597-S1]|nr:hypothetical protein [Comamonadaceae bacterium G21597-S1]